MGHMIDIWMAVSWGAGVVAGVVIALRGRPGSMERLFGPVLFFLSLGALWMLAVDRLLPPTGPTRYAGLALGYALLLAGFYRLGRLWRVTSARRRAGTG